ncbi:hypothetical protein [Chitinophaga sp.]|uniref:hypothetical protein n=1 Tax=Chitinophaga sp. TaxID=1869181 RepID=UPI0031D1808D
MKIRFFGVNYLYYYGVIKKKNINSSERLLYPKNCTFKAEHKRYLKELVFSENERQNAIEGKTSQLIGQCGLIFSLLGLFVPVFFDKFVEYSIVIKLMILFPFFSAFFFFILTINNAIKNYNIKNFKYISGSPSTVCKDNTEDDFHNEEINDLILAIRHNAANNNDKGSNLLHAFRAFRAAIFCIAIMGFIICILMLFKGKEEKGIIRIAAPVKIDNLDSNMQEIKSAIIEGVKYLENSSKQIPSDTINADQ